MAKKIAELSARTGGGGARGSKYPLDEWLNGDAWLLEQGSDFESSPQSMANLLRKYGYERGFPIATRIFDDGIEVQALVNESVKSRNGKTAPVAKAKAAPKASEKTKAGTSAKGAARKGSVKGR